VSLRLQHIYVTNEDTRDELPTYVFAKNILKGLVTAADLRTPICAYLYGVIPEDNSRVVEVKAIAVPPQRASQRTVELPDKLPEHQLLEGMQLVGLAVTQSQDSQSLQPLDAIMYGRLIAKHTELGGSSIMLTISFTPGSLSLAAYALNPKGFEWARTADPNSLAGALHLDAIVSQS
jgi:pre-mRNA-processing factor 8